MDSNRLDPKTEARKLLVRFAAAVKSERIPEDQFDGQLDMCAEDLELIFSGRDTGARWSIGTAELKQGFKNDPKLGLDENGNVFLKDDK